MPDFEAQVFDMILRDIEREGVLACPETVKECEDILRKKADGTKKSYELRTAAFLKMTGADLDDADFKQMVARIIKSKDLRGILHDFVKYGNSALFESYSSTFKEAFAGGLTDSIKINPSEIKDSIANIKVILEQEKEQIGLIELRAKTAADNVQIADFLHDKQI